MNYRGYKFLDEQCTRRSAEVLTMLPKESLLQFEKRCDNLGFTLTDSRNLIDHYKFLSEELIQADLETKRHPNLYLMCVNIINDFNIASLVRNGSSMGCREIILYGDKKFDRRGCVGANHYTNFKHVKNLSEFEGIRKDFDVIVSLENCAGSQSIYNYQWPYDKKMLLIVGQESIGVPGEFLEISDVILEIPLTSCLRSINVASAGAIALYSYNSQMPV